jgi:hypothetical protein
MMSRLSDFRARGTVVFVRENRKVSGIEVKAHPEATIGGSSRFPPDACAPALRSPV